MGLYEDFDAQDPLLLPAQASAMDGIITSTPSGVPPYFRSISKMYYLIFAGAIRIRKEAACGSF
jgi:hypothetical protein